MLRFACGACIRLFVFTGRRFCGDSKVVNFGKIHSWIHLSGLWFLPCQGAGPLVSPNLAEMTGNSGPASSSPVPAERLTCFQLNDLLTAGLTDSFARNALTFLENQELKKWMHCLKWWLFSFFCFICQSVFCLCELSMQEFLWDLTLSLFKRFRNTEYLLCSIFRGGQMFSRVGVDRSHSAWWLKKWALEVGKQIMWLLCALVFPSGQWA